jgi:hypothetical protein
MLMVNFSGKKARIIKIVKMRKIIKMVKTRGAVEDAKLIKK